jgi:hypothetical protein
VEAPPASRRSLQGGHLGCCPLGRRATGLRCPQASSRVEGGSSRVEGGRLQGNSPKPPLPRARSRPLPPPAWGGWRPLHPLAGAFQEGTSGAALWVAEQLGCVALKPPPARALSLSLSLSLESLPHPIETDELQLPQASSRVEGGSSRVEGRDPSTLHPLAGAFKEGAFFRGVDTLCLLRC